METDHLIYLSSLANLDEFPKNSPCGFENLLKEPIVLDSQTNFSIGLVNILLPKNYYALKRGDLNSSINVYGGREDGSFDLIYNYTPRNHILSGNISHIVETLNRDLSLDLKLGLKSLFPSYFKRSYIIKYNPTINRVYLSVSVGECSSENPYCKLALEFSHRSAAVLGFEANKKYIIFNTKDTAILINADIPPRGDARVDYALIYCDKIEPVYFADKKLPILDAFVLDPTSRSYKSSLYKRLNTNIIDRIAIKITDQFGLPIFFDSKDSVTVVLRIKPSLRI